MGQVLWIGVGGAIGTMARYGLSLWCRSALGTAFPYGTFAVNVIGSFLLGAIMTVALRSEVLTSTLRLTLGTGVMGGFTTYSTFNYETLRYFDDRAWALGGLNVGATLLGCWVAGALGILVGRRLGTA